ncbi:DUF1826 domain-containing protein [uncultured Thiohalocapsa sp.]|uniref:DUF1826 domain-containing protein n=1 Tax=uncultured Thiohalocapsa sp. TaxID=768990 RepID=UPI0025F100C4|nr:DUF1826 domain-containing protein [uncultured Thiohalocapsa sp.]
MTSAVVAPQMPRPHRPQLCAANTAPDLSESGVVQTPDAAGLGRIAADGVTLAIWRRAAPPDIDTELARCTPALSQPLRCELAAPALARDAAEMLAVRLTAHGLPVADCPRWLADMAALAQHYAALVMQHLGAAAVTLRLEALADVACPRFHVDQTRLRLLCAYRGPGTHWLPPAAVDRAALAAGAPNERIADPARVQALAPGWVGLFKGERWPGNADRGQVHRSPPAAEGAPPRLLFCLDT